MVVHYKSSRTGRSFCTGVLVDSVGDERLKRIFERLPIADEQLGKIEVAKELGLLTPEQRRFIRFFARLRNQLVHRVENVDFSFKQHVLALKDQERTTWKDSLAWFCRTSETKNAWSTLAIQDPKTVLWTGVLLLVSDCSMHAIHAKHKRILNEAAEKRTAKVLREKEGRLKRALKLIDRFVMAIETRKVEKSP